MSYLLDDGGESSQRQSIGIFAGDNGTAQLDDQPACILELAAVGEDGGTTVRRLEGALITLSSLNAGSNIEGHLLLWIRWR